MVSLQSCLLSENPVVCKQASPAFGLLERQLSHFLWVALRHVCFHTVGDTFMVINFPRSPAQGEGGDPSPPFSRIHESLWVFSEPLRREFLN